MVALPLIETQVVQCIESLFSKYSIIFAFLGQLGVDAMA